MAVKSQQKPWYQADKNQAHKAVAPAVKFIKDQQRQQRRDIVHYLDLYSAGNVSGLGEGATTERLTDYLYDNGTRFNLAGAVVDTAVSMIATAPAVPQYLTSDGDFSLIRRAEKRTQILQGQVSSLAADLLQEVFLDCAKTGTGIVHGFLNEDGLADLERVHPLEMLVEHTDGLYGNPRSVHRVRLIAKEVLKAQYPEHSSRIEVCCPPSMDAVNDFFLQGIGGARTEMVEVWESHHLKPGKKGKGRHTICIENCTLLDEEYQHSEHPYVVMRYRKRDFGFFGAGLVESVRSAQNRVNDLIYRVSRAQDLGSNLVILNPNGENAVKQEQITNELGLILNYDPLVGPPQLVKWDGSLGDLQEQISIEFERALVVEGLSSEQVNGEGAGKGLTSGVAVRAADDVQSRRLVQQIKRYQTACIETAKLIERLNDDALAENEDYEVRAKVSQGRQNFLRSSRWADLAIPEGQANIVMMPMSALPTTPQGKWASVLEWLEGGFVNKTTAMSLLEFPDLDAAASLELAHMDLAKWQVERMLDGEEVMPLPRQDLALAMDLVTRSQLKAQMMGAPDDVIDLMESYLVYAEQMLNPPQDPMMGAAPGMPAPGPMPGMPPAGPGAPMPGANGVPVMPAPGPLGLQVGPAAMPMA